MSFKHESKKNDTELSKHLWHLKDQKKDFAISWKILAKEWMNEWIPLFKCQTKIAVNNH